MERVFLYLYKNIKRISKLLWISKTLARFRYYLYQYCVFFLFFLFLLLSQLVIKKFTHVVQVQHHTCLLFALGNPYCQLSKDPNQPQTNSPNQPAYTLYTTLVKPDSWQSSYLRQNCAQVKKFFEVAKNWVNH